MTVPGRTEAATLLLSLDPPPWFLRHSRAVAEVAGWLAARIDAAGIPVDRRVVEGGALLHDADKALPADDPAKRLRHGDGSAAWLTRMGHPELARAVANHPVTRLADEDAYRRWAAFATREERIVAYADKRAAQHLEPMAVRFDRWRRRHSRAVADGNAVGWDESEMQAIWLCVQRDSSATCVAPLASPRPMSADFVGPAQPCGPPRRRQRRGRTASRHVTTSPLAYLWGDDDLSAGRAVDGLAVELATETGAPPDALGPARRPQRRRDAARDPARASRDAGEFGGGSVGRSSPMPARSQSRPNTGMRSSTRSTRRAGERPRRPRGKPFGSAGPAQKRLAEAIAAAGGTIREFKSPRAGALAGWIEAEARERGLRLASGTAKTLAERVGGFVQEGDAERRYQTRIASMELDKLALFRGEGGSSVPTMSERSWRKQSRVPSGVSRCRR